MIRFNLLLCSLIIALGASAANEQNFTLTGNITGLQQGDTLRFERIIYPTFNREPAFDIIIEQPNSFSYTGQQSHDQDYLMTFIPKEGSPRDCDKVAQSMIITDGDHISLSGSVDDIYYCTIRGGIYDDPLLSKALHLDDTLGIIRSSYLTKNREALAEKDTANAIHYINLFNNFGSDDSDPDIIKLIKAHRDARKAYSDANPQGSIYLLIESLSQISYTPLEESRSRYDAWSQQLKDSYYGRIFASELYSLERLADGKPVPEFSATAADGTTVTANDYKGQYLLIYHWGMCPGSLEIDSYVRNLHDRYSDKGLAVLGLTGSLASIRETYDRMPEDFQLPGGGDIRTALAGMLAHPWKEVEVNDEHKENLTLNDTFKIGGLPFFIFIGPEGTIRARGFSEAFSKASEILDKELGTTD